MKLNKTHTQVVAALGVLATVLSIYAFVQGTTDERIRCWDGSVESKVRDCAALQGRAGLPWLFPSLPSAAGCSSKTPGKSHKTAISVCDSQATTDGYLIRYTAWTDVESAFDYYNQQYDADPLALVHDGQRVGDQWSTNSRARREMPFKMSGAFYHAPFSWSVEATSLAALEQGRSQLDIREVDRWTVDREMGFWARLKHGLTP